MRGAVSPGNPVIVFGGDDSSTTRAALRFFKERRIEVQYSDVRRRALAPGELKRFAQRLGAAALADRDGRIWRELGLGYLSMSDAELAERLLADQRLLRLPLVRVGNRFAAGPDEAAWRSMVTPGR
ncbi:MAG: arsenate reductase [Chloroflexi bacterium]|nr:arsenate reductase [Chloroflexota bacterium]